MKLPRRQFLHLAAGAAALPAVSRDRAGANLSVAAGALIVGFAAGRRDRHYCAPDRAMAVGAARPAIRHREPAGRGHQYRHRGGREASPPDGYTLLLVSRRMRSTRRSTTNSISISFATSRRSRALSARPTSWRSIRRFRRDGSRVHRLCQGQSRQDQHGVGRQRHAGMSLASCSR